MTENEYLLRILTAQSLDPNGPEISGIRARKGEIEYSLGLSFADSGPTIRIAGSFAKGTAIKASYDLDIACYFDHEDRSAGETLADIFGNVKEALSKSRFRIQPKTSALRIRSNEPDTLDVDFHMDVVPGRFTGPERSDAFLHVASREKSRLKTNLDTHVEHIQSRGCLDEIRLLKLWNARHGLRFKTFVLELLTIKVLNGAWDLSLPSRLRQLLEFIGDRWKTLAVEDPANPYGNDLGEYLDIQTRYRIGTQAKRTLRTLDQKGWMGVFGPVRTASRGRRAAAVSTAARQHPTPARPWGTGK